MIKFRTKNHTFSTWGTMDCSRTSSLYLSILPAINLHKSTFGDVAISFRFWKAILNIYIDKENNEGETTLINLQCWWSDQVCGFAANHLGWLFSRFIDWENVPIEEMNEYKAGTMSAYDLWQEQRLRREFDELNEN